jgi:uncharacterized protein (DUF1810 family)
MNDRFHLQRFINAQQPVFDKVCAELAEGRKRTHWMWFIFPQIQGLGHSEMAHTFAISSLEEAKAYLQHPILGARLHACSRLVANIQGRTIEEIFGYPDDLKFHSCMTLFAQTAPAPGNQIFLECMEKYFGGKLNSTTLKLLSSHN